jgi:adenosylcobinamide-phosphate synthase
MFTFILDNSKEMILLAAASLDYLIADPKNWLHPVQIMGWIITQVTKIAGAKKWQRRLTGIILGAGLIIGSGLFSYYLIKIANFYSPSFSLILQIILLASCFAARSLRKAANEVLQPLGENNLPSSRQKLSQYVGRDTDNLSEAEIFRAVLETVAENTTDGVTAPLFYAILGSFLPFGSVPLALAYKAASTLDSMIGYREEPFTDLGWFSAKFEDLLTWFPCRLTVLTLALISGKPGQVWLICRRDAIKDPSPNSGWSESVYAAILGVQLGGTNTYQGLVKEKPLLGDPVFPITPAKIQEALNLTRFCCLIWLAIAFLISYFSYQLPMTTSFMSSV